MRTVKRSELEGWKMLAGNEDMMPIVIDGGRKKVWNSVAWHDVGPASELDKAEFPAVVEDE